MSGDLALPDHACVLLDTAPVIHLLEDNAQFLPRFWPLFQKAEEGRLKILVTPITVAEVLAGPLKVGKEALAARYEAALTHGLGWTVVPLDIKTAARAAQLRVRYHLKLPDAFQLAAALEHGVEYLVTHDRDFGQAASEVPIWGTTKT